MHQINVHDVLVFFFIQLPIICTKFFYELLLLLLLRGLALSINLSKMTIFGNFSIEFDGNELSLNEFF